jgi:hypothetical protein
MSKNELPTNTELITNCKLFEARVNFFKQVNHEHVN